MQTSSGASGTSSFHPSGGENIGKHILEMVMDRYDAVVTDRNNAA